MNTNQYQTFRQVGCNFHVEVLSLTYHPYERYQHRCKSLRFFAWRITTYCQDQRVGDVRVRGAGAPPTPDPSCARRRPVCWCACVDPPYIAVWSPWQRSHICRHCLYIYPYLHAYIYITHMYRVPPGYSITQRRKAASGQWDHMSRHELATASNNAAS